jgi:hypothetical protein
MKVKWLNRTTAVVTLEDPIKVRFVKGVGYCDECRIQGNREACYKLWQKDECKGGNFQEVKD